jgi:O-antigen ligase
VATSVILFVALVCFLHFRDFLLAIDARRCYRNALTLYVVTALIGGTLLAAELATCSGWSNRAEPSIRISAGVCLCMLIYLCSILVSPFERLSLAAGWWQPWVAWAYFATLRTCRLIDWQRIMDALLGVIVLEALVAIAAYHVRPEMQMVTPGFGLRARGTFESPNALYPLCMIGSITALSVAAAECQKYRAWLFLIAAGISAVALILTFNRSGLVGFGIGVATLAAYLSRTGLGAKWMRRLAVLLLIGVCVMCLLGRTHGHLARNLSDRSIIGRVQIWRVAERVVLQAPILGGGIGTYQTRQNMLMTAQLEAFDPMNDEPKSLGLAILAESGIVGLLVGLWLVFQIFVLCDRVAMNTKFDRTERAFAMAVCSVVAAILTAGLVDTPVIQPGRFAATVALGVMISILAWIAEKGSQDVIGGCYTDCDNHLGVAEQTIQFGKKSVWRCN